MVCSEVLRYIFLSVGVHKETKLSYLKIEYTDVVILYFTKQN